MEANEYVRTILKRTHHLIRSWGWKRADPIVGTLFDFFARNKLASLRGEEQHGSMNALESLDQHPNLESEASDRSFHLFLKILATTFQQLQAIYPEKKVRSLIWRCIPNHGRVLRKVEDEDQASDGSMKEGVRGGERTQECICVRLVVFTHPSPSPSLAPPACSLGRSYAYERPRRSNGQTRRPESTRIPQDRRRMS